MGLSAEQLKAREGRLTASAVAPLMTGDESKLLNLWRELTGDPSFAREDLSGVWPVRLGEVTEQLQLDWYERKRGCRVTRRGEVVIDPQYPWAAATLDGWDDALNIPIECKHVAGRELRETVLERYQPQFHWQMWVTRSARLRASIIEGANEPIVEEIEFDQTYGEELWARAETFMEHVRSLTPPVRLQNVTPPVPAIRVVDMTGNNEFADAAHTWLEHCGSMLLAADAEKKLKRLVPADAKLTHGYGVKITRDRAGKLSLREKD